MSKAADAAAMEINWRDFRESGETHAVAQAYAHMNKDYLGWQDIWPWVRSILVNVSNNMVYVSMEAELSIMFSSLVPRLIVEEGGEAQIMSFRR